jgi:6,7-dimethyl-8-ribityllumazine synthase
MPGTLTGNLDGSQLRIGIVVSRWNSEITYGMLAGAQRALVVCGVTEANIVVAEVPGAYEIPIAVQRMAEHSFDAIIALGCVVKGETAHFEYISEAAIHGIREVGLKANVPVTCGILTTYTMEQAIARSGLDDNNKGSEAALAAVETATMLRGLGHALYDTTS